MFIKLSPGLGSAFRTCQKADVRLGCGFRVLKGHQNQRKHFSVGSECHVGYELPKKP